MANILFDPTREPEDMVISLHGRRQGAAEAGLEYAKYRAPIEFPDAEDVSAKIDLIQARLFIVDRPMLDVDP